MLNEVAIKKYKEEEQALFLIYIYKFEIKQKRIFDVVSCNPMHISHFWIFTFTQSFTLKKWYTKINAMLVTYTLGELYIVYNLLHSIGN